MKRFYLLLLISSVLYLLSGCQSSNENKKPHDEKGKFSAQISESSYQTIPVGKGPDALFATPDYRYVYVANVEDTVISVIDAEKDTVIKKITGIRKPWGFTRLGQSDLVAVSGWGRQVGLINFKTHEIVASKKFDDRLAGITSSSGGDEIFAVNYTDKKVLRLNRNLEVVNRFNTGGGPDGIGISKNGKTLYVTNTKDGSISIINMETGKYSVIQKGGKPELIHASSDNARLYISNFFNNEAYILNTTTDSVTHTIANLNGPEDIIPSLDGKKIYVVNFTNSKVYVFDSSTYVKLDEEYIIGAKPIGFVQLNDTKAYVSNYGDNSVSVVTLND